MQHQNGLFILQAIQKVGSELPASLMIVEGKIIFLVRVFLSYHQHMDEMVGSNVASNASNGSCRQESLTNIGYCVYTTKQDADLICVT